MLRGLDFPLKAEFTIGEMRRNARGAHGNIIIQTSTLIGAFFYLYIRAVKNVDNMDTIKTSLYCTPYIFYFAGPILLKIEKICP